MAGCGPRPDFSKKAPPPPKPVTRELNTEAGSIARRDPASKRTLWSVAWKSAKLEYTDDNRFGGTMEAVSGTIYQDGKPVSDFTADSATASKADNTLELSGKVVVKAREPKGSLSCRSMRYDGMIERVEALGGVRVETELYQMGPFERVYAKPDLSRVATPDMFEDNDGH